MDHIIEAETDEAEAVPLINETESDASSSSTALTEQTTSSRSPAHHIPGAVANLCSATLGAGILALPFALYQAGLICGCILLLASAWATTSSINLLVEACDRYKLSTYEKVVEQILGQKARKVVEISILIFCLGTAVGYVIAVGDVLERVVYLSPSRKRLAMTIVWLCAMLPLSCLKRIQSMQCASTVGIFSIGTLLAAAIVHLVDPAEDSFISLSPGSSLESFLGPVDASWLGVLRACPIVFFAFSCQVNVAQIYDELPGRGGEDKVRTMGWVTLLAVGLCGLLYSSISLVSLMDFGSDVQPNMLSCYTLTGKETLLHIAFMAMALAIVMAFPLNVFPARVSIIQMIGAKPGQIAADDEECQQLLQPSSSSQESGTDTRYNVMEEAEQGLEHGILGSHGLLVTQESSMTTNDTSLYSEEDSENDEEFDFTQHVLVTVFLAGAALGLALIIPNISVVFGLLGGTTSSLLGFVIPGLMGLRMNNSNKSAWILVIAGSIIGVLTTAVTLYTTIHHK